MRCYNCKDRHATVAEVRACHDGTAQTDRNPKHEPMWPASDKQINYVMLLQEDRRLPDDYKVRDRADLKAMDRDEVSSLIVMLKSFPWASKDSPVRKWTMPAGRYAIWSNAADEWWFFQVDQPTEGRWRGYTFIKRLIGAPGDYRKVPMGATQRNAWLDNIERDPKTAMLNYGKHSGVCGRCSSPLTDATSLKLGMGPVCRSKSTGWF